MPEPQAQPLVPLFSLFAVQADHADGEFPLGICDHRDGLITIGYPEVWGQWIEGELPYPQMIKYDPSVRGARARAYKLAGAYLNEFQAAFIDAIDPALLQVY